MPNRWLRPATFGGLQVKHSKADPGLWGQMTGHPVRKVVWHTTESDPGTIEGVARWVHQQRSQYTLLWDPSTGEVIQLLPADVGARACKNGWFGFPTNRYGEVCIQIGVVGRAEDRPLGRGQPLKGVNRLRRWLIAWGVPPEAVQGGTASPRRSRRRWKRSGHHTHSSAPRPNDHTDPGKWSPGWVLNGSG